MIEVPGQLPKELLEAARRFDKARAQGKRPMLNYDAINILNGARVTYTDDDTRREENPYDEIITAMTTKIE
jgi:hypothetical protein